MVVEYIRYKVPDASALIAAYEAGGESLRASPHCLGYELTRCVESVDTFILRILWDSADGHLQGFRKSDDFKRFFAAIQAHVKNIEEMRHYEVVGSVHWMRGGGRPGQ